MSPIVLLLQDATGQSYIGYPDTDAYPQTTIYPSGSAGAAQTLYPVFITGGLVHSPVVVNTSGPPIPLRDRYPWVLRTSTVTLTGAFVLTGDIVTGGRDG